MTNTPRQSNPDRTPQTPTRWGEPLLITAYTDQELAMFAQDRRAHNARPVSRVRKNLARVAVATLLPLGAYLGSNVAGSSAGHNKSVSTALASKGSEKSERHQDSQESIKTALKNLVVVLREGGKVPQFSTEAGALPAIVTEENDIGRQEVTWIKYPAIVKTGTDGKEKFYFVSRKEGKNPDLKTQAIDEAVQDFVVVGPLQYEPQVDGYVELDQAGQLTSEFPETATSYTEQTKNHQPVYNGS